jgi:hypothetical protein
MAFQEVGWGGMDWTHFALDRDRWQAFICEFSNEPGLHKMREISWLVEYVSGYQGGLCSM